MPIHSMTCVHPCPPMLFKLRLCIQKSCNVHHPPTPSLGWIGQIKDRSLSLASTLSASWLAYSLHPRSLTPIWSWMQGCTKSMPTHAHPKPMGMGMGTQCRALLRSDFTKSPPPLNSTSKHNLLNFTYCNNRF
jgi:hypothetical protein